MLNEAELISLIVEGESQRVDFKRELDLSSGKGKSEFVKDIISLANSASDRGFLLIGVDDDKRIVGINAIDEERIQQIANTYITPPATLRCAMISIRFPCQASVGVIEVRATYKPHKVARSIASLEQNEVFVRHGSVVMKASPEEIIGMSRKPRFRFGSKQRIWPMNTHDSRQKPHRTLMRMVSTLLFWAIVILVPTYAVISNSEQNTVIVGIAGVIMGVMVGAVLAAIIRAVNWLIERRQSKKPVLMAVFWITVILGIVFGVFTGNNLADAILGGLIATFLGIVAGAIFVVFVWMVDWLADKVNSSSQEF